MDLMVLSWFAGGCAMAGALLISLNLSYSHWGWWLYLASNFGWIAYATNQQITGLLAQQLWFLGTSAIGIWRSYKKRQIKTLERTAVMPHSILRFTDGSHPSDVQSNYRIVQGYGERHFQINVNNRLKAGWQLHGPLHLIPLSTGSDKPIALHVQAMIRDNGAAQTPNTL